MRSVFYFHFLWTGLLVFTACPGYTQTRTTLNDAVYSAPLNISVGYTGSIQIFRNGSRELYDPYSQPNSPSMFNSLVVCIGTQEITSNALVINYEDYQWTGSVSPVSGSGTREVPWKIEQYLYTPSLPGLSLEASYEYVNGDDYFTVSLTPTLPQNNTEQVKLYHLIDTYLGGSDEGPAVTIGNPPYDALGVRDDGLNIYQLFVKINRAWDHYASEFYGRVLSYPNQGNDLSDNLDFNPSTDNAIGVQWNLGVAQGRQSTISYRLSFSPTIPNLPPTITSLSTWNVIENTSGTLVDLQSNDDSDSEGNGIHYRVAGGPDAGAFQLDSLTGHLSFHFIPDFEAPQDANLDNIYRVDIAVEDSEGEFTIQTVQIRIVDQNETSPGGVFPNLSTWLRADMGTSGFFPLSSWTDQGPAKKSPSIHGDPLWQGNRFNYNPAIVLDGSGDYLSWLNLTQGFQAGDLFLVLKSADSSAWALGGQDLYDIDNSHNQVGSAHPSLQNTLEDDFANVHVALEAPTTWSPLNPYIYNSTWGLNDRMVHLNNYSCPMQLLSNTNPGFSGTARIGSGDVGLSDLKTQLAEVIIYDRVISLVERQRVHSYLALKYGITLLSGSSPGGQYLDSQADTLWDGSKGGPDLDYHHHVAGIGRDDVGQFQQRQGGSGSPGARVQIGLGSIQANNQLNPSNFAQDRSYVIWGHNQDSLQSENVLDLPFAIEKRIARVWKIHEIVQNQAGSVGDLFFRIDVSHILGEKKEEYLRLLVDEDGIFSTQETHSRLHAGNLNGDFFELSIPDAEIQDGFYFSLGSLDSTLLPLPIQAHDFQLTPQNAGFLLSWEIAQAQNGLQMILEKQNTTQSWSQIHQVFSNSDAPSQAIFSFLDENPAAGTNYYRLRTRNAHDLEWTSAVRSGEWHNEREISFQIYPNPSRQALEIRASEPIKEDKIAFILFSPQGDVFLETEGNLQEATHILNQKLAQAARGHYTLRIRYRRRWYTQTLIRI